MSRGRHRKPVRRPVTGIGFVTGATMAATVTVILNTAGHATHTAAVVTPLPQPAPVMLQLPPLDVATAALYLPALPPAPVAKPEPAPAVVEPVTVKAAGTTGGLAARAVAAALGQRGSSYVWGGSRPGAFDCSGLVMWAYAKAGINLPRTAAAQATMGRPVSLKELQPGDLLAFYHPVEHIVMYVGDGKIVEASQPGVPVHVIPMYTSGFAGARRII